MSIRILVADDHAVFRSGLRALLEKEEGFEIVGEAGTGLEAIELLERRDADIVILDINMPGLSGARVAADIIKKRLTGDNYFCR